MTREIKFRGKSVDTGEWLDDGCLLISDCKKKVFYQIYQVGMPPYSEEIIPETIGQFTGIHDKKGKYIYEGDIVKYFDIVTEVCWDEQHLQWYILWADKEDSEAMYVGMDLEIIGNIHENPELLETNNQ